MSLQDESGAPSSERAAPPWILEHLLAYPGTYEIPLRTMYTLNSTTQSQPPSPTLPVASQKPGNAFTCPPKPAASEHQNMSTATAAAQLRANLMSHIKQLPSQPSSLPPSFVTSFVRRCFTEELDQVDFPQALTAMDYLKDLEVRRRREVVAALSRLGIEGDDLGQKDILGKKYPGVLRWVLAIEGKERNIEAQYSQLYIGLRRWTLINEMSTMPFNKASCLAMLNTLYPPTTIPTCQFVQPTAQLTPQILSQQRNGFWRYMNAVEKNGPSVLSTLMEQHKRPGEATGWNSLHDTLEKYLVNANSIIDECYEISSREMAGVTSPTVGSFSSTLVDDDVNRRKVDSGVSFTSTTSSSSNRTSAHSYQTRPSTSSTTSAQSTKQSKEKPLPEKPLPSPTEQTPKKHAGSTFERFAREVRKIRSRGDIRDTSRNRPSTAVPKVDIAMTNDYHPPPSSGKERSIRSKLSLSRMRSSGALKERDTNTSFSAPVSRDGGNDTGGEADFDVEEMKRRRMIWEAQQKKRAKNSVHHSAEGPMEIDG